MTLATLKTDVATWMARTDLTDAQIELAVRLCEAKFTYGYGDTLKPLRVRAMETAATLSIASDTVALPTDYLGMRSIYIDYTPKVSPKYVEASVLRETWPDNASGMPVNYTIEGENIVFGPAPDDTYSAPIIYYKKFDALSDDADTNWALQNRPDIYLYGVMAELEVMLDGPNFDKWFGQFAAAVAATNAQDKADRFAGSALVMNAAPRATKRPAR